jgi:hypothetical protein
LDTRAKGLELGESARDEVLVNFDLDKGLVLVGVLGISVLLELLGAKLKKRFFSEHLIILFKELEFIELGGIKEVNWQIGCRKVGIG